MGGQRKGKSHHTCHQRSLHATTGQISKHVHLVLVRCLALCGLILWYLKNPGPLNILDWRLCQLHLSPSFCFIISVLECGSGYVFQDWHQMTPSWVARTVNPPTWLATVALAFSLSWETSCYLSLFCPRLAWREEREKGRLLACICKGFSIWKTPNEKAV